tara:strand:+ start:277 stop:417 length:141 start_codon:yes stop_codon:yes gene_type:complete
MLKIKTKCGVDKYHTLKIRKGLLNKIRFYWYVLFAGIRDIFKKKSI